MKKFILVLLLFVSTMSYAQESKSEDFENYAFRMYGSLGTGIPFRNLGMGLSYAYEAGNFGKNRDTFFGISSDVQLGYSSANWLSFNVQSSISVGKLYQHGGRFSYDIIGFGYGLIYSFGDGLHDAGIFGATPGELVINFLSFHHTSNNGFYFSWRNNLSLYSVEFRSYFTIGFDFSKLYNPRVYRER